MKRTLSNYFLLINLNQSEHHSQTGRWYSSSEITFQLINCIALPPNGQKNAMVGVSITRIEFQKKCHRVKCHHIKKKHQAIEIKKKHLSSNIYCVLFQIFNLSPFHAIPPLSVWMKVLLEMSDKERRENATRNN